MLGEHAIVAFLATTDADRAKVFYTESLGLRLVADEPFALVFDACGTMLRIQKAAHHEPPQHTLLGWNVPDIAAAVRALQARGVAFQRYPGMDQDALGVWIAPGGTKVAWFKDPDGNLLSLTEF